ncbi:MAG: flagellar hook-basal body protein [Lachnospiraceae bacterium]
MRVTNAASYRNFTSSINDIHSKLNKSMNKVSSGKAYEKAADNPLAYYEGKKIDNQYQDTISKLSLAGDLKNRLYHQELGARSIQELLSKAKTQTEYIRSDSNNGDLKTVETVKEDLLQKMQSMVNELNGKYQNYYIYGGNDSATAPFSLSADGTTLTFSHQFAGNSAPTEMAMTLTKQSDGTYQYAFGQPNGTDGSGNPTYPAAPDPGSPEQTMENMLRAMKEQGRVDIGYGNIADRNTMLDTYTGGLNLLTGLNSDALNTMSPDQAISMIEERMNQSPIGLLGKAVMAMDDYANGGDKADFSASLGTIMDDMSKAEHTISTVYSDLGNRYALLTSTEKKLDTTKDLLAEQYQEKLGADPYESIMEVYAYQYSYAAAQKVGAHMMQSSLFDFMR